MRRYRFTSPVLVASFIVSILMFMGRPVWAKGGAAAIEKPVVLVIGVGTDPESRAREQRFVTNLALDIDGFDVQLVSPPTGEFASLSLDRQIEHLKPMMSQSHAVAAMWLTAVSKEMLLLQVVVLDTGRALVRLFEGKQTRDAEEHLALTASELLGTAYMFDAPSLEKMPEIHQLVTETREHARVSAEKKPIWRVYLKGIVRNGVVGGTGPRLNIGGALGAEREILDWFALRFGMSAAYGPFGDVDELGLKGYDVSAEISGYWFLRFKRIQFGPVLRFRGGPTNTIVERTDIDGADNTRTDYSAWSFNGALGVDFSIALSKSFALSMAIGLEATPLQIEIQRLSDKSPIFANSLMNIWGSLGFLVL